jgi:hypothetical protein
MKNCCCLLLQILLLLKCFQAEYNVNPIDKHYNSHYLDVEGMDSFMANLTKQWIPLTFDDALNYFTSYEVCQVFTGRKPENWCAGKYPKIDIGVSGLGNCAVHERGNHYEYCPHLFNTFYRHVPTTSTPPVGKNLIDFMFTALSRGYHTLYFIGDSVIQQEFNDIPCQLIRYGDFDMEAGFNVYYIKNLQTFLVNNSVPIVDSHQNHPRSLLSNSTITFTFRRLPFYKPSGAYHKEFVRLLNALPQHENGTVIVLFNTGLHFNSADKNQLEDIYRVLFPFAIKTLIGEKQQIIMFRETNAQHFPTKVGLFEKGMKSVVSEDGIQGMNDPVRNRYSSSSSSNVSDVGYLSKVFFTECRPILTKAQYDEQNWRNQILDKVLNEVDPSRSQIHVIPFYAITAPRYDLHIEKGFDCTHLCHGPMVWFTVNHQMTVQLENIFTKQLT